MHIFPSARIVVLSLLASLLFASTLSAQTDNSAQRTAVVKESLREKFTQRDYENYLRMLRNGEIPRQDGRVGVSGTSDVLVNNNGGASATSNFTQSETDIIAYGNYVVIAFNDAGSYNGSNNQFTGWAYSTNGGVSFTDGGTLPASTIGDAGDPVLARNETTGRIYLSTLGFSTPGTIQMFRSDNNGVTWMAPTVATPGGSSEDKQWHTVDNFPGPGNGNVYMISRRFGTGPGIYVFRSTDHGDTFTPSGGVNIVSGQQGAYIAVGPDHAVYAFWYNGTTLQMRKSTDFGATFAPAVIVYTGLIGGTNGDLGLTGIRQGLTTASAFRSSEFPHVAINPVSGNLYVTFANKGAGTDKADVFLVQSTDGGTTWGTATKINDDATTTDQWQPTIAVTPDGGQVGIFYYSRQEDPVGNNLFKYYGRIGNISGSTITWQTSFPVSDVASLPEFGRDAPIVTTYMGDYNHAVATSSAFHVVWSDNRDDLPGGAPRKDPNVYYKKIPTTENFGWVRGTVTSTTGGAVQNISIDFVQNIVQAGALTDAAGFYLAGVRVDTPGTTANVTLRARKFGYVDTTLAVTLTRNDTLTRNFSIRPAPGGTLSVHSRHAGGNLRSYVEVKFGTQTVVSDSTNATTGLLTAPLPTGTYSVRVDPPPPYGERLFPSVVITEGATTNIDALTRPVVEYAPSAMRDTLAVGGSRTKILTVTNTTSDSIPFRITDDVAMRMAKRTIVPEPAVHAPAVEKPKGAPDTEFGATPDGRGGPDAFGYQWIDSDEPDGPVFNWFDISTIGTEIVAFTPTRDDGVATIPLPWAFPFYGINQTSLNVVTNGFLNFGTTSTAFTNGAIPSTAAPNNAIYAFWDDLDIRTSGKVFYYNDVANGRFVVQYDKAPRFGTTAVDTVTFQIFLKPNGEILYQYLRAVGTVLNSATIGVENAAGTVALQVAFNTGYIHNNLATRIFLPDAPWLSENPSVGKLPPNADTPIQVTFDATGLSAGTTYNGKILLDATHPKLATPFQIPASLRVNAADSAVITLTKTSITYPATQVNTSRADSLYARNGGAQTLVISSITSNSARYAVTPASANVAPGDSVKIRVTYSPTTVGSDTGRVIILSNSQGTPRRDVTLNGTGIGAPSITVSVTTIADTLQVGQNRTKTFTITNATPPPTNPLYVSITDSVTWLNVTPALDTLAGSQTKSYNTAFNATGLTVGTYTANIRIASNDPANPLKIVVATLRVIGGPVISVRPDSVVRSLAAGAGGTDTLTIRNTGVSALNWQISEAPGEPGDMSTATQKYHTAMPPLPKGMDYPVTDDPDTSGGPDAFGYRFIDSDSPGGPTFSWVDISSTGTRLDSTSAWIPTGTFSGFDEGYFPVVLPFSFNFYGVPKDTLFIGTNGNVMFQRPTADIFTNAQFPTAGGPIDNHIGVFWDDLQVSGGGARVYYGLNNGKFVVQFQNMPRFSGTVPNYTFEVILSPTGEILTQYLAMAISGGILNSASIGIENATGTIGLGVLFNAAPPGYMHNNLAILFSRGISWLEESPTSGTVNPGDSAKVVLTYNTTGLTPGLYRGILSIASNDFSNNPKNVPVRLTVTGGTPSLTVTAPNGGELWNIGQAYNITWNQNQVDSVTISYSTTGRTGTYTTIASVPARPGLWKHPKTNARLIEGGEFDDPLGTFSWTIPNTPSTNCYVRIVRKSTGTPGDTSDAAFTIRTAPVTGDTSWVVQPSGSTSTFYAVKAVSNNVAWVAGTGGVVLRTTNGGTNWSSVGGGAIGTADIYSIEALDANTAFVTTTPSTSTFIYRTTNGGSTWTQVYTLAGGFINGMIMVNPAVGFAAGDPVGGKWTILATTDGGATWARIPTEPNQVGTEAGWNNSFVIVGNSAWFGTNSTKVYRTTDVGTTWSSAATTTLNSYGLHFNDAASGALVGSTGTTNYSTNGGTSWVAGGAAGTGQGSGVSGVSGSEFWATVGSSVYYSTNGGATWSNAAKNGYPGATALWALDMTTAGGGTYGWAAGATGTIVRYRRIILGVEGTPNVLPTVFALDQNFPNPFNPSTTIRFSLPEQATVSLKIFNVLGQEIATLAEGEMSAAFHNVVWNGRNNAGSQVASGMYFYRFEATGVSGEKFNSLKKLVYLR